MKVYIVYSGEDYEVGTIEEIFSKEDDANDFAKKYSEIHKMNRDPKFNQWRRNWFYLKICCVTVCNSLDESDHYKCLLKNLIKKS